MVPGNTYLVQVWVNDGRDIGESRSETMTGGTNTSAPVSFGSDGSGPGQYIIGTFVADSSLGLANSHPDTLFLRVARLALDFEFDQLLIAPGSERNFFDLPGVGEWAVTMKTLTDAALLRNRVLGLLEEASLRTDPALHRQALTFVTAGGGFSGVETAAAVNDLVREAVRVERRADPSDHRPSG